MKQIDLESGVLKQRWSIALAKIPRNGLDKMVNEFALILLLQADVSSIHRCRVPRSGCFDSSDDPDGTGLLPCFSSISLIFVPQSGFLENSVLCPSYRP